MSLGMTTSSLYWATFSSLITSMNYSKQETKRTSSNEHRKNKNINPTRRLRRHTNLFILNSVSQGQNHLPSEASNARDGDTARAGLDSSYRVSIDATIGPFRPVLPQKPKQYGWWNILEGKVANTKELLDRMFVLIDQSTRDLFRNLLVITWMP